MNKPPPFAIDYYDRGVASRIVEKIRARPHGGRSGPPAAGNPLPPRGRRKWPLAFSRARRVRNVGGGASDRRPPQRVEPASGVGGAWTSGRGSRASDRALCVGAGSPDGRRAARVGGARHRAEGARRLRAIPRRAHRERFRGHRLSACCGRPARLVSAFFLQVGRRDCGSARQKRCYSSEKHGWIIRKDAVEIVTNGHRTSLTSKGEECKLVGGSVMTFAEGIPLTFVADAC